MELSIKGKNAIVCASSQGLGKSAAIDLAKEGVNLALCSRSKEKVDAVKEEISNISDVKVVSVETDLNSSKDIKEFYTYMTEGWPPKPDNWEKIIEYNLNG